MGRFVYFTANLTGKTEVGLFIENVRQSPAYKPARHCVLKLITTTTSFEQSQNEYRLITIAILLVMKIW